MKTGGGDEVISAAKNELERIEREYHTADSKSAWWRDGYSRAVESLKRLAASENYKETPSFVNSDGSLDLRFFHDEKDGLI